MILFIYYTILLVLFASLASFFMVVGSRTVYQQSFTLGRSKCDHCQVAISPIALIPLLGYIIIGGKCTHCKQPIPFAYPLCEGYFAISSLLLFRGHSNINSIYIFIAFIILLMMTSTDLALQIIPDRFQIILCILVIIYHYQNMHLEILTHSIFALLIFTTLITCNYLLPQGIGGGDIKTLTILALFHGPLSFPYLLMCACGLAICHIFYLKLKYNNLPSGLPFLPYLFFAYPIIFYIL
ncbi:A24 family peptidase [Aerococcus sp. HMSC10H05]|uniref:prepilin peptidase n=1 Tax=Aerococcus sp. HMSC10H05 TaxID=1581084 RepID=UPI0008A126BD|nr:A24 family peptidase [Aerococcus sp. HMSC10H05]OFU49808.1 prepilin peptidase [Aerococcus sp. HMSC10H05]